MPYKKGERRNRFYREYLRNRRGEKKRNNECRRCKSPSESGKRLCKKHITQACQYYKKSKQNSPQKHNLWQKTRYQRKMSDPLRRLNQRMSTAIWRTLKVAKAGRHWETLVDFTLDELKWHLEKQFRDGMTWGNYGSYWQVDHVKPLSKCVFFAEAWTLDNLQPLTADENRSKHNYYDPSGAC
jgi:hypothetical protein